MNYSTTPQYESISTVTGFAIRLIALAKTMGYPGSPVTVSIWGPSTDTVASCYAGAVQRKVIVANSQPADPIGIDPVIWVDAGLNVYKSSNWYGTPGWDRLSQFMDMWNESSPLGSSAPGQNNSGFLYGVAQGPVTLTESPVAPLEAATKQYVDLSVAAVSSGAGSSVYGIPVQTILELQSIPVAGLPDTYLCLVEETHKLYSYDQTSALPLVPGYVVAPLVGTGQWIASDPYVLDGGSV